jgi:hypothetical protein
MGNFSRSTFDPAKRYAAVRLQQGVPLVDADWNELQDVTRNELYDGLSTAMPNAVGSGITLSAPAPNDLQLAPGFAVAGGRPLRLTAPLRYTTQRYANPATAAADGVPPAAPLTTPTAARSDTAFLDLFEREVGKGEDPDIVNPAIGIETAVRVRREVVLRVAEGASAAPAPATGHVHLQLATLNRAAGQPTVAAEQIEEVALRPKQSAIVDVAIPPLHFAAVTSSALPAWEVKFGAGSTVFANKPVNATAFGIAPLYPPNGSRLRSLRFRGTYAGNGNLSVAVVRARLDNGVSQPITSDLVSTAGAFDRILNFNPAVAINLVDTQQFHYYIQASAGASADVVQLNGYVFRYIV